LPRPVNNENDLKDIGKLPYTSLRTPFKEKLESMISELMKSIEP